MLCNDQEYHQHYIWYEISIYIGLKAGSVKGELIPKCYLSKGVIYSIFSIAFFHCGAKRAAEMVFGSGHLVNDVGVHSHGGWSSTIGDKA